jgi:hypothetical protein
MVWYATLATTTGSGVVVATSIKVKEMWPCVWKGGDVSWRVREYNQIRGWAKTNLHMQLVRLYPRRASALMANDANPQRLAVENIEAGALLRQHGVRANRKSGAQ